MLQFLPPRCPAHHAWLLLNRTRFSRPGTFVSCPALRFQAKELEAELASILAPLLRRGGAGAGSPPAGATQDTAATPAPTACPDRPPPPDGPAALDAGAAAAAVGQAGSVDLSRLSGVVLQERDGGILAAFGSQEEVCSAALGDRICVFQGCV
jgi:hypothetical protein